LILKPVIKGIFASIILLSVYFTALTLISGWNFAKIQFDDNWYWIIALSIGYGIQIALFTYLRALHRAKVSAKVVAASGTTSTAAMISCCAHYLVNILPVIGISGAVAIIGQYQIELFWLGIISNLAGIAYMTKKLLKVPTFNNFPQ